MSAESTKLDKDVVGKPDRGKVLQKLLALIVSDLASRDGEELESLLRSIGGFQLSNAPSLLVTGNEAAMVFLHPRATREAAVAGLRDAADWIAENWEQVSRKGVGGIPERPGVLN